MQQVDLLLTSYAIVVAALNILGLFALCWKFINSAHSGKPRGYAFIEYEHKNNMKEAYKRADGKKVEGKRVVVDVERGRTVPNWYVLQMCFRAVITLYMQP